MKRNTRLKVGIIGIGRHGSRYANHLVNDLGDTFHLAAVSRRSGEGREQAAALNAAYYKDWRDLIASREVDAVIAVTTPNLNQPVAAMCAEFGKPLLLEKPLSTDYHTGRQIVDLMTAKDIPFTVAQTLRYNHVIQGLKNNLQKMGGLSYFSACQRLEPSTLAWLEQPEIAGGGVIFHTAVHMFDAIRYITGREIVRIRATSQMVINSRLEDVLVAEVLLEGDCPGVVDASKVSPARAGSYEFICNHGILQGDQIHSTLQQIDGVEIMDIDLPSAVPTIVPLLTDWHEFLTGKGKNPVSAEEGLAAVKACHACRLAASTGLWVNLEDLDRLAA